jgi:lipoprotein-anchoring transpeptidase ErfK/SrfK
MRRTTFGFAGLVLLVLTGSALVAQGFAPSQSRAPRARHAAAAQGAAAQPAAPAADLATPAQQSDDAATLLAAGMPGTTQLVSPKWANLAYWDGPGRHIIGVLPGTTWGGPTVRPVDKAQAGWLQIRLDTRPNGSTAWVPRNEVTLGSTPYRIVISVSQRSLTLYRNNQVVHAAPVGVGRPQWPTPLGPSFVDALFPVSPKQQRVYGPLAIITASHSNVFTEFDGGDGTVAIHGYPSDPASTAGVMSSHGCIRTSPQTITALSQVSAGTPIDIVA